MKARVRPSEAFLRHWKSGLAEMSTYRGLEERYGALRPQTTVMVFVYEEIDDKTRIKVESDKVPAERRIPVLKLNRMQRFNTGIYEYSVMTSVFAGLSGPGITRPFSPRKISLTAQEWCGMVFQQALPRKSGLELIWHSYFEGEGEGSRTVAWPRGEIVYEDELPLLLRELDGPYLAPGESRPIQLYPAEWRTRKAHKPAAFTPALLRKEPRQNYTLAGQTWPATVFTLEDETASSTWIIEDRAPRKLLAWQLGRGGYGVWQATTRQTYWTRNRPEHEALRKDLRLAVDAPPPPQGVLTQGWIR